MLEVNNLRFRWDEKSPWLLDGVNLRVAPGEIVGIMGHSGCGKSTLARLLSGHMPMQAGQMLLDEKPLPDRGVRPVQLVMQHAELALNPRWRAGQSLCEGWQPLRDDECAALDLPQASIGWVREVYLRGHGQPWVYARSVAARSAGRAATRSSAAPRSSESSPTRTPSPAWSGRSCLNKMTNGRCRDPDT